MLVPRRTIAILRNIFAQNLYLYQNILEEKNNCNNRIEPNKIAKTRVLIHASARNFFSINSKRTQTLNISTQIKILGSQLMNEDKSLLGISEISLPFS
ncbi:hypothetical protein [Bartonella sp. AR 15-3]|uniref:hypothetical protein n=1 Tax=Bartonella sp. AR 15-3 TaxID=545617 RepID=UPI001FCD04F2|nr:hypothetical protein [Bartonella sp. AR 15-3]